MTFFARWPTDVEKRISLGLEPHCLGLDLGLDTYCLASITGFVMQFFSCLLFAIVIHSRAAAV